MKSALRLRCMRRRALWPRRLLAAIDGGVGTRHLVARTKKEFCLVTLGAGLTGTNTGAPPKRILEPRASPVPSVVPKRIFGATLGTGLAARILPAPTNGYMRESRQSTQK